MPGILERIWSAVEKFPERIAHTGGGDSITYRELWGRSCTLAAHLRRTYLEAGPVAVRGHKENGMLVSFLGSVLAGRPYIPLDRTLPEARVDSIIATAKPVVVLTPLDVLLLTDGWAELPAQPLPTAQGEDPDRKSTRLNSSHT